MFNGELGTVSAVSFSVGALLGAASTLDAWVANRQRERRTLRMLGIRRVAILWCFPTESVLLAQVTVRPGCDTVLFLFNPRRNPREKASIPDVRCGGVLGRD
jgi:hypothetical protein